MFELKPLSADAVSSARSKIERYRLLNEPMAAESICRDVLAIEPNNQDVIVDLILTLTDQFTENLEGYAEAREWAQGLEDEYKRAYYQGIVYERRGLAHFRRGTLAAGSIVYDLLRKAMDCYEQAEQIEPPEIDDAVLRWNTCARIINTHDNIKPPDDQSAPIQLE